MGTFKLALVAVALLAALAGCGKPVEPVTTAESTTEAVTTTEASKKLAQGSENGVAWRELDLEDEANREIFEWLSPRPRSGESGIEPKYEGPKDKETRLSDTKTLIERPRRGLCDILLRDETTGAEIMLIESNDDEGAEWYSPYIEKIIDERFFWFGGTGWEWIEPDGVYDTQRMLAMYVEPPERCFVLYAGEYDGVRYYSDEIYGEECGQLHVYPLKPENLDTAKTLMTGENLLKDIP
ncbi:MAG: hypothetical protein LBB75_07530, partial [Oscillospiraceae bacterium]|nr:hypothetical protein [Oscillospiraceae bacterium]